MRSGDALPEFRLKKVGEKFVARWNEYLLGNQEISRADSGENLALARAESPAGGRYRGVPNALALAFAGAESIR